MRHPAGLAAGFLALIWSAIAGQSNRTIYAFPGPAPKIDGVFSPGEWGDATQFYGSAGWTSQYSPVTDEKDLAIHGFVKHDNTHLYFGFSIRDDVLYGIDTPRWLPEENPKADELTAEGYPWFGDSLQLLINASNSWDGSELAQGDGYSWQAVCNLTKSRKGGIGVGGLLEGEPRRDPAAWSTYRKWIDSGAMSCAAKPNPDGGGYVVEWAIAFNPCLKLAPGEYYSPGLGTRAMGFNLGLADLDTEQAGEGNFGRFHHEEWFAGPKDVRTQLQNWGTIWIVSDNGH